MENKESKEKKKTPPAKRAELTVENMGNLVFPGLAAYSLLGWSLPLAALFGGAYLLAPDLAMKEKHPIMDKIGNFLKGITK